jgi:hypothetical protein
MNQFLTAHSALAEGEFDGRLIVRPVDHVRLPSLFV